MKPDSPRNHATSIPGLYACGECDYAYHGANRLGANSLLSASYSGRVAGEAVVELPQGPGRSAAGCPRARIEAEVARQQAINRRLMRCEGDQNPYALHRELGELMTAKVGVVRDNRDLDAATRPCRTWPAALRADQPRTSPAPGPTRPWPMPARCRTWSCSPGSWPAAPAARDECRGAHHKPEFALPLPEGKLPGDPEYEAYTQRWKDNNDRWLKTTVAQHSPAGARDPLRGRWTPRCCLRSSRGTTGERHDHPGQHPPQDPPPGPPGQRPLLAGVPHPLPGRPQRGLGPVGHPLQPGHHARASGWTR